MRTTLLFLIAAISVPAQSLRIYAIDVEGGKATLYVSPSGESMLFDTGYGGNNNRDADRIVAAAKDAGVKQIDYLVISHYHGDHVSGVAQLAAKMPIKAFFDYGEPSAEAIGDGKAVVEAYVAVRQNHPHTSVKAGDTILVKGLRVDVVAAAGATIMKPLPGAGQPNSLCSGFMPEPELPKGSFVAENAHSVAMVITFGKLRIVDFGDLTQNPGEQLTCPVNKLGTVDLYMPAHHGAGGNPPEIVHALRPRVEIVNNQGIHGADLQNWTSVHSSPGFEDLWQLHWSDRGGRDHNAPDDFIANPVQPCEGKWIDVSATADGAFTVRNSRNGFQKTYPATGK